MSKEYCNLCWAKLPDGTCFCDKTSRAAECKKARMRLSLKREENTQTAKELQALRDYLAYISMRLAYLNATPCDGISNERKYYVELYEVIKGWGKSHEVFFKYLIKKINLKKLVNLYGASQRVCERLIAKQRKELIDFITLQEVRFRKIYPFEPCE